MPPPLRSPLSLESLDRRVRDLEDERRERDLNGRQTADRQSHEFSQAIEAAVAQFAAPRFGRVDADNAQLLASARRSEAERDRRIAAEVALAGIKEREELARVVQASDRKHALQVWGVIIAILTILGTLAGAAINSHH